MGGFRVGASTPAIAVDLEAGLGDADDEEEGEEEGEEEDDLSAAFMRVGPAPVSVPPLLDLVLVEAPAKVLLGREFRKADLWAGVASDGEVPATSGGQECLPPGIDIVECPRLLPPPPLPPLPMLTSESIFPFSATDLRGCEEEGGYSMLRERASLRPPPLLSPLPPRRPR